MRRVVGILLLASLPLLGATNATAQVAVIKAVKIVNFAFSPARVTITKGTTVRWTNSSNTTHTVTNNGGAWGSGNLGAGTTYSHTFTKAGTFGYHCTIHPSMKGTVVVQP